MPSTLDAICLDEHWPGVHAGRRRSFPDFAVPDFLANRNMTDERIDSGAIPGSIRFDLEAKTAVVERRKTTVSNQSGGPHPPSLKSIPKKIVATWNPAIESWAIMRVPAAWASFIQATHCAPVGT